MDRVILLVDMNAFFIACETTRNPRLAGKPAAVAGDPQRRSGIVLAASYEARAYGVKTAMTLHEALKLCPGMLLVPPDHGFYEEKSQAVMRFLAGFTPVMEQNSIDEAYLDLTGCESLHGPPEQAALTIQSGVHNQFGLWCSIGIAPNKFLAKMASEMKKPMGITRLSEKDIPLRLWPLPVQAMHGVGRATAARLAELGIRTIGDLASVGQSFLSARFGKYGYELMQHAHGRDEAPVIAHDKESVKSIGRSTTLAEDLTDPEAAKRILLYLADDIGGTTRSQGHKGNTVQITLKFNDFSLMTRQARIGATCTTQDIYRTACRLLDENWQGRPLRLIGVSLSGFNEHSGHQQLSLFDLAGSREPGMKQAKLDKAIDAIRGRYGTDCVTYGKLLHPAEKQQTDESRKKSCAGRHPAAEDSEAADEAAQQGKGPKI